MGLLMLGVMVQVDVRLRVRGDVGYWTEDVGWRATPGKGWVGFCGTKVEIEVVEAIEEAVDAVEAAVVVESKLPIDEVQDVSRGAVGEDVLVDCLYWQL